jgi:hypothetical protein
MLGSQTTIYPRRTHASLRGIHITDTQPTPGRSRSGGWLALAYLDIARIFFSAWGDEHIAHKWTTGERPDREEFKR